MITATGGGADEPAADEGAADEAAALEGAGAAEGGRAFAGVLAESAWNGGVVAGEVRDAGVEGTVAAGVGGAAGAGVRSWKERMNQLHDPLTVPLDHLALNRQNKGSLKCRLG